MKYYGIESSKIVTALQNAFDLLERYSPGSKTQEQITFFKEADVLNALKQAVDIQSFAKTLHQSGLAQFTHDTGFALKCHAHLDTDGLGRNVFKTLTATGQLAQCVLTSLINPVVTECDIWRGTAYAQDLLGKNKLLFAWNMRKLAKDETGEHVRSIVDLKGHDQFADKIMERLGTLEYMQRYLACNHLAELCGYDSEGDDVRGRSPLKHYQIKLEIPSTDDSADMGKKLVLQKQIYDFAATFRETTQVAFLGHGIEGALSSLSKSLNDASQPTEVKFRPGAVTADVTFKATVEAAQAIARAFPSEKLICLETRKAVEVSLPQLPAPTVAKPPKI